jgi:hypothetical protein
MDLEPLTKTMLHDLKQKKRRLLADATINRHVKRIYNYVKELAGTKVDFGNPEFKNSTSTCFNYDVTDVFYTSESLITLIIEKLQTVFPDCSITREILTDKYNGDAAHVICVDWT